MVSLPPRLCRSLFVCPWIGTTALGLTRYAGVTVYMRQVTTPATVENKTLLFTDAMTASGKASCPNAEVSRHFADEGGASALWDGTCAPLSRR